MNVEILTKNDLQEFRKQLLQDLASLLSKEQSSSPAYLRSKEVRKMLNISAGSLSNLRIRGLLTPTKISGIYYYRLEEIQSLLDAGTAEK